MDLTTRVSNLATVWDFFFFQLESDFRIQCKAINLSEITSNLNHFHITIS